VPNYPNPARLYVDWLATNTPATANRWLTAVPDTLTADLPIVVATRYGGNDPHIGLDIANLDVNVYATGTDPMQAEDAALDRCEDVRRTTRLHLPGRLAAGVWVNRVRIIAAPTIRPYDSAGQVRRAHMAVALTLHQPI
jgi:hypothetical protein